MSSISLLIFNLGGTRFGLNAMQVRESVWLPKLTPVEEVPIYIVGIFNLRGQIVPVTDLNLRFEHPAQPYHLSNQVVVLELENALMGLIVSEVCEVIEIPADTIQPLPKFENNQHHYTHLVIGEARVGDDIVMLLDVHQLMMYQWHSGVKTLGDYQPSAYFCPQATAEEQAVFQMRAKALTENTVDEEMTHLSLVIVELGEEYFGIELQAVQEFCEVLQPSPIPCCPPHILGAISLRGNLLTLMDIRSALNVSRATHWNKVVIARCGEQMVGVAVDDVIDVIYLREEELQVAPTTLREQHGSEIKGTAPYAGKMMAILNLPLLLARKSWIVNENV